MLTKFLYIPRGIRKFGSFSSIRVYCQYSGENESQLLRTAVLNESSALCVLNNCNNWNFFKYTIYI